jgi:hypothetical protein
MLSDLLFHLLSGQLSRAGAPGTRPEESEAILQELETAIRLGATSRREEDHEGRRGSPELDLVSEYLQTVPQAFSEEAHAWFLERVARQPDWARRAGRDAVVVRYITTADPFNRFLAAAAQLAAHPATEDLRPGWIRVERPAPSVAPIANALLDPAPPPWEGAEAFQQWAEPSAREKADAIAELTEIVVDLSLENLPESRPALTELADLVRGHREVQELDPVGRVLIARAEALGGSEAILLRSIAKAEDEERREEDHRGEEL